MVKLFLQDSNDINSYEVALLLQSAERLSLLTISALASAKDPTLSEEQLRKLCGSGRKAFSSLVYCKTSFMYV